MLGLPPNIEMIQDDLNEKKVLVERWGICGGACCGCTETESPRYDLPINARLSINQRAFKRLLAERFSTVSAR
jgi:hypothetical protein